MSHENAPATALVATRCAACGRELLDAVSVETGMGPHCRKQHRFGVAQGPAQWDVAARLAARGGYTLDVPAEPTDDAARRAANALVHRIAAAQGATGVEHLIAAVSQLGFEVVARAIAEHLAPHCVSVERVEGRLVVRAEHLGDLFEAFVEAMRSVPGRRWNAAEKANEVPAASAGALWSALQRVFPAGTVVIGNRVAVLA